MSCALFTNTSALPGLSFDLKFEPKEGRVFISILEKNHCTDVLTVKLQIWKKKAFNPDGI